MINVYIVSGFLGAGKTTLIQKMLEGMESVMLIENEFGEVGVDSAFFADSLQVKEINNGCICCSLKGDFKDALDDIRNYNVKNLIIEPSGVGKLSDIMPSVLAAPDMRLVSHACVVDVKTASKYHKNFKEYFDDQVIMANAIVLSHLDVADETSVNETLEIVRMLNDEAEINTRPITEFEHSELMDFMVRNVAACVECEQWDEDGGCECEIEHHHHHHHHHDEEDEDHDHEHEHEHEHHHHHHHHHDDEDEPFDALAFHTDREYSQNELEEMMSQLDDSVIRCKGYVNSGDKSLYFNYVLNEININEGSKRDDGLIVIIGTELDEEKWKKVFALND